MGGVAIHSADEEAEKNDDRGRMHSFDTLCFSTPLNRATSDAMKLAPNVEELLKKQVNNEMFSSYAYLAMSAWLESTAFRGFTAWMTAQSHEETAHAMKFYHYIHDRDGRVDLEEIEKPQTEFESPLDVFKVSLAQEQRVTAQIHEIYNAAEDARDHETKNFLNWFLTEQVEEEKTVREMIERLELVGDDPIGLLRMDEEAAQRGTGTDGSVGASERE
ncbi:MAG: ferritin [Verrucomicrobiales bacterium]|jgi:ferritin